MFSEEASASDPLPGGGEDHPVIGNTSNDDNGPLLMPVDVDDLNEANIGRDGSATSRSTSQAESVEIRFEEPEVIASDTGANRAEDIPLDVGGNFG